MATSATERDIVEWVRDTYLPKQYKQKFAKKKVKLTPGGTVEFDAVSEDASVIANISTASYLSSSDSPGVGKMHEIRSNAFFLLLVEADKKSILFTEEDMHDAWQKEQIKGRLPADLRLMKVELPSSLRRRLDAERK